MKWRLDQGSRWLFAARAAAAAIAAWGLAAGPAAAAAESEMLSISREELHALGISVYTAAVADEKLIPVPEAVAEPFPHACFGAITVSDELLASMQKQGFTLTTLCIGLTSPQLAFHPETGARLTRVRVPTLKADLDSYPLGTIELLIDIPRCFARGTPYLDCKMLRNWNDGSQLAAEETREWARKGAVIDATMKQLIASKAFSRPCTCKDFQAVDVDPDVGAYAGDIVLREQALCTLDFFPHCPSVPSRFSTEGSMAPGISASMAGGIWQWLQLNQPKLRESWAGAALNEQFHLSEDLPRGYAYNPMTPEGDNDKPPTPPAKGRKLSVGSR